MAIKCVRAPSLTSESIREIHVFDLDRTLACSNTGLLLARYLVEVGEIPKRAWLSCVFRYVLYKMRLTTIQQQIPAIFDLFFHARLCRGIFRHLDEFWARRLCGDLRGSLLEQVRLVQQRGQLVAIFSAAPDFLVEYIAKQLGIHFILASEYRIDRTGTRFCALGQVVDGTLKAQAVQRLRYRFKRAKIYGYSDSRDDSDFLQVVDYAWLVAPDHGLQRWAKDHAHAKLWVNSSS